MNQRDAMENYNYHNDYRTRASYKSSGLHEFNERKMIAFIDIYNEEEDCDEQVEVNVKFEVCPTCQGHGKHVNPNIDCMGLTEDDFGADPDFYEAYMSGFYDVNCYECGGRAVVPVIDKDRNLPDVVKAHEKAMEEIRASEAYSAWERSMGA